MPPLRASFTKPLASPNPANATQRGDALLLLWRSRAHASFTTPLASFSPEDATPRGDAMLL
jgi:hypothetical protein